MISEAITTGTVDDNGLHLRNKDRWLSEVRQIRGEVECILRRRRATRSEQQNRWYWGVIVARIHDRMKPEGWTEDDVHDFLKAKFIPKRLAVIDHNGEVKDEFVVGGTTTRLNKLQFGEFCEAIRRWAAEELALDIPDPDIDHDAAG